MFETIFSTKDAELGPSSHKDVVDIFLNAATFSKHVDGCAEKSMSIEDFRNWCTLLPSVKKFLGSLLIPPDAGFLLIFRFVYFLGCCFVVILFYILMVFRSIQYKEIGISSCTL
jgi:hypothetical protein